MPTHVERRGSGYVIVETATGKVKGHSKSKRKAEISSAIRTRAWEKKNMKSLIDELDQVIRGS